MIAGLLFTIYKRDLQIEDRLIVFLGLNHHEKKEIIEIENNNKEEFSLFKKLLGPLFIKIKHFVMKKASFQYLKGIEKRLREAGRPFNWTPVDFIALQIFLALCVFALIFFLGVNNGSDPIRVMLVAIGGAVIGIIYPNSLLRTKKLKRKKQIERTMPDFFDMTNLAVEAGMGLDAALSKVCKQIDGPLSEEFLQVLEDMKLGKSRREAFIDLRNRVPSENFHNIITQLIQADQLGIGMAKVIKSLIVRIREQQREAAREKANKVPVKMLFPIVFLIFPSLFIVILGPIAISFLSSGAL